MNLTEGLKKEVEVRFIKSSGPGGQNVNKRNTAVQLRWNLWNSSILNEEQKVLVSSKLSKLITHSGDLVLKTGVFRDQESNFLIAIENLSNILLRAIAVPNKRIKTKPTHASKQRRLTSKKKTGEKKKLRKRDY